LSKIKLNANAKQLRLRSGESRILANRLLRSTGQGKKFPALITGEQVPNVKKIAAGFSLRLEAVSRSDSPKDMPPAQFGQGPLSGKNRPAGNTRHQPG